MTKKLHTATMAAVIRKSNPNTTPASTAQLPLAPSAIVITRSRPCRSAATPPHTHPAAPTAITRNTVSASVLSLGGRPAATALAARNAGIHVQNEYSSRSEERRVGKG